MKPGDLRRWAVGSNDGFFLVVSVSNGYVDILDEGEIYTFILADLEQFSVEADNAER